jgi:hypothetical protein
MHAPHPMDETFGSGLVRFRTCPLHLLRLRLQREEITRGSRDRTGEHHGHHDASAHRHRTARSLWRGLLWPPALVLACHLRERWPPRPYPPSGARIPVIDAHPRDVGTSRTLAMTAVPCVNTVAMPRRLPSSEAKAAPSVWPNLYLSSARIETLHRITRKWKQARYGSEVRTVYTPNSLKGPY